MSAEASGAKDTSPMPQRRVAAGVIAMLAAALTAYLALPYVQDARVERESAALVVSAAVAGLVLFGSTVVHRGRRLMERTGVVVAAACFFGSILLVDDLPRRVPLGLWAAGMMLSLGLVSIAAGISALVRHRR